MVTLQHRKPADTALCEEQVRAAETGSGSGTRKEKCWRKGKAQGSEGCGGREALPPKKNLPPVNQVV